MKRGIGNVEALKKLELLMKKSGLSADDRPVVKHALIREEATHHPACAFELPDGTIMTGKTTDLMVSSAAVILNTIKEMAGIPHEEHLISPEALQPILELNRDRLKNTDPRLSIHDVLTALSISSSMNENARLALNQLENLKGLEMHSTVLLSESDESVLRKLLVNVTCEPRYEFSRMFQK